MGLTLGTALRLFPPTALRNESTAPPSVALVGAGGKTTAIFLLAREAKKPAVITSTTHLGSWQVKQADRHIVATTADELPRLGDEHVTVVTGAIGSDQRTQPVGADVLERLRAESARSGRMMLIEGDGSRQKPLKAPDPHEPCVPDFADLVVVVAGLSGLGKPLSDANVHRAGLFSKLSGIPMGAPVSSEALVRVLTHPDGGLKGIPVGSRRVALLNQAEAPDLQARARGMVGPLLSAYDSVVIGAVQDRALHAVHEPCAGIVLAAGEAKRFGRPKQLLAWQGQPFVRAVALAALQGGLNPVIVVTGAYGDEVAGAVADLPITIVRNPNWQDGQSSSVKAGLRACPASTGSAVFMLADQPQVTPAVLNALQDAHAVELNPIVAPLILEEKRGNPVLFDRVTFTDLLGLAGDTGGRALFSKHPVRNLPWQDAGLLLDIDREDDYRRLLANEET